jgi:hypothetical protein
MSCNCEPDKKRTYYSSVQLFSEPADSYESLRPSSAQ